MRRRESATEGDENWATSCWLADKSSPCAETQLSVCRYVITGDEKDKLRRQSMKRVTRDLEF